MSLLRGRATAPSRIPRRLELIPIKFRIKDVDDVYIEARSNSTWVIKFLGEVLNKKLQWEFEPSPSNRSDALIKRTRYATLDEALKVYEEWERADQERLL